MRGQREHRPTDAAELLPFEEPLRELERQIAALERSGREVDLDAAAEFAHEREELRRQIYARLTAWDRVCLARHPGRPTGQDYLTGMCDDFLELRGDRRYADDPAVFAGLARIEGRRVVLIADRKGHGAREGLDLSFGMARPEGYRKALRAMRLAEKFHLPVVTLIDTPGASPTIEAEDRGQAHAIAENLAAMSRLRTPIASVVVNEGGSAGALAGGVADWLAMLENAYYCVVSPEAAAAVLWNDAASAPAAAAALKLTALDLLGQGLIDEVIAEPYCAAHVDKAATVQYVKQAIVPQLDALAQQPADELVARRYARYRRIGVEPA